MDKWTKILSVLLLSFIVLSVSATFYKTVILQDFDVTGVYVEFPTKDTSSVWFVYDNKEYELELETVNYDEIVSAIASELAISETELEADFLGYLQTAYDNAEVTGSEENEGKEPTENMSEEIDIEMEADDASQIILQDQLEEPLMESDI